MTYEIRGEYFTLNIDFSIPLFSGRYMGNLGSWISDGWVWYFDDVSLLTALIHIEKSSVKDEFIFKFEKSGLPFSVFKKDLIATLKSKDTLDYLFQIITGWRESKIKDFLSFTIEEYRENEEVSPERIEHLFDLLNEKYPTIEKAVKKELLKTMPNDFKKVIERSQSIEELIYEVGAIADIYLDDAYTIAKQKFNVF